jgi:competence protein ComEC
LRFGELRPHELVLLQLPVGRAPPQGSRLEVLGVLALPRGPDRGFDERSWLRRQGVHVVLRGDRWRRVGARGGLGGIADALHERLARSVGRGLHGERRAVVEGVLLGEDGGLPASLRRAFRASGLYHLLAVSGQNVGFVAAGALVLAWIFGLPRVIGELAALAGIGAYVLAVGPQPSVLRAGVAGALGSLAWLTARQRDRWYALLLGAFALLAWNPYLVRDAGFQLSFAAVVAIFTLAPRIRRALEGWPLPKTLADTIAISTACGAATAPIAWIQFHAVPLLTVPANAAAAAAVVPLLWLSFATVAVAPLAPGVAAAIAWVNGWFAAYLIACARVVAAVPGAQLRSGRAVAAASACVLLAAAYAWHHVQRAEAGLPPHRLRPAEDRPRAAAAPGSDR